jgi:hypothetical protein
MLCMACTQHREYTEKLTWSDPFSVPSELRNRRGGVGSEEIPQTRCSSRLERDVTRTKYASSCYLKLVACAAKPWEFWKLKCKDTDDFW